MIMLQLLLVMSQAPRTGDPSLFLQWHPSPLLEFFSSCVFILELRVAVGYLLKFPQ